MRDLDIGTAKSTSKSLRFFTVRVFPLSVSDHERPQPQVRPNDIFFISNTGTRSPFFVPTAPLVVDESWSLEWYSIM